MNVVDAQTTTPDSKFTNRTYITDLLGNKKSLLDEVYAMRCLFGELPCGDDSEIIDTYFNNLEQHILKGKHVQRDDQFNIEPSDPDVGSGSTFIPTSTKPWKKRPQEKKHSGTQSLAVQRVGLGDRIFDPFDGAR